MRLVVAEEESCTQATWSSLTKSNAHQGTMATQWNHDVTSQSASRQKLRFLDMRSQSQACDAAIGAALRPVCKGAQNVLMPSTAPSTGVKSRTLCVKSWARVQAQARQWGHNPEPNPSTNPKPKLHPNPNSHPKRNPNPKPLAPPPGARIGGGPAQQRDPLRRVLARSLRRACQPRPLARRRYYRSSAAVRDCIACCNASHQGC